LLLLLFHLTPNPAKDAQLFGELSPPCFSYFPEIEICAGEKAVKSTRKFGSRNSNFGKKEPFTTGNPEVQGNGDKPAGRVNLQWGSWGPERALASLNNVAGKNN